MCVVGGDLCAREECVHGKVGGSHVYLSEQVVVTAHRGGGKKGGDLSPKGQQLEKEGTYSGVVIYSWAMRNVEVCLANLLHPHLVDWETKAHTGEKKVTHRSQDRARLKSRPPDSQTAA